MARILLIHTGRGQWIADTSRALHYQHTVSSFTYNTQDKKLPICSQLLDCDLVIVEVSRDTRLPKTILRQVRGLFPSHRFAPAVLCVVNGNYGALFHLDLERIGTRVTYAN